MQPQKTAEPTRTIELKPLIGAEIVAGIESLISGTHAPEIRTLIEERGVVVLRRLNLTDEQQIAFTRTLGPLVEAENVLKISMDPKVNPLAEYSKGAFFWHIDGTTLEMPMFASLLSGRQLATTGGQTEFANTYAAYDGLSEADKAAIEGLRVVHSFEASQRYVNPEPSWMDLQAWQRYAPKTIPLVWTHKSGRKSLVLGSTASHIEGMDFRESSALLTRLRDWATAPQFVYTHEWTLGDLVIWDNTGTMHRVLPYPHDCGRLMHRTQIAGDEPFA